MPLNVRKIYKEQVVSMVLWGIYWQAATNQMIESMQSLAEKTRMEPINQNFYGFCNLFFYFLFDLLGLGSFPSRGQHTIISRDVDRTGTLVQVVQKYLK